MRPVCNDCHNHRKRNSPSHNPLPLKVIRGKTRPFLIVRTGLTTMGGRVTALFTGAYSSFPFDDFRIKSRTIERFLDAPRHFRHADTKKRRFLPVRSSTQRNIACLLVSSTTYAACPLVLGTLHSASFVGTGMKLYEYYSRRPL